MAKIYIQTLCCMLHMNVPVFDAVGQRELVSQSATSL